MDDAWDKHVTDQAMIDAGKVVWLEACLRAADADRDRLRAAVAEERDINLASGCPDCGVHDGCFEVVAERDRLRAVADGVRSMLVAADARDEAAFMDATDFVRVELRLLDGSPDMGSDHD